MENLFFLLIVILLLYIAVRFCYYPVMLSSARDKLFAIRLDIRNYFAYNKLDMNSEAYKDIINHINFVIRYIENGSIFSLFFSIMLVRKMNKLQLQPAAKNIDYSVFKKETKQVISKAKVDVAVCMLKFLFVTSFIGVFMLVLFAIFNFLFPKNKILEKKTIKTTSSTMVYLQNKESDFCLPHAA